MYCTLEISGVLERIFLCGLNYLYFYQQVVDKLLLVKPRDPTADFASGSTAICLTKYYQIAVVYIIMLCHSYHRLNRLIQPKTDF